MANSTDNMTIRYYLKEYHWNSTTAAWERYCYGVCYVDMSLAQITITHWWETEMLYLCPVNKTFDDPNFDMYHTHQLQAWYQYEENQTYEYQARKDGFYFKLYNTPQTTYEARNYTYKDGILRNYTTHYQSTGKNRTYDYQFVAENSSIARWQIPIENSPTSPTINVYIPVHIIIISCGMIFGLVMVMRKSLNRFDPLIIV
jgi:hypothetical protein